MSKEIHVPTKDSVSMDVVRAVIGAFKEVVDLSINKFREGLIDCFDGKYIDRMIRAFESGQGVIVQCGKESWLLEMDPPLIGSEDSPINSCISKAALEILITGFVSSGNYDESRFKESIELYFDKEDLEILMSILCEKGRAYIKCSYGGVLSLSADRILPPEPHPEPVLVGENKGPDSWVAGDDIAAFII